MPASDAHAQPSAGEYGVREPIAIIGIGCRFPGGVHDLDSFWQLLRDEVDAIIDVPADRFNREVYVDPTPAATGKIITPQGGFLTDKLDQFDAAFFGISPREAITLDPQQRLLLETSWEALENAGLTLAQLSGSRTGVYVGMWTNEYKDRVDQSSEDVDLYTTTGTGRYTASGRLSFQYDLRGPSLTLDTHCSSSLVAVHLACQSLRTGETDLALVGATNLILDPFISVGYSRSGMLAPGARCKFGDENADGYVRSEGVGVLVLKPLSHAQADGDRIHALIMGSATNNDGRGSGLLVAPSKAGQISMLKDAYRNAGIHPSQVSYIEAHGTGTPAGDPVELEALGEVLREGRPTQQRCAVGSVKTNIGHTEAAAGMAGLIKTVLCLKHKAIPASLHLNKPTTQIDWEHAPLQILSKFSEWKTDHRPLIAGVSSFGIAGTNAHVVLQEAPPPPDGAVSRDPAHIILPISADTPEALHALAAAYAKELANPATNLNDLLYTASQRRSHLNHRLAVSANSKTSLSDILQAFAQNDPAAPVVVGQAESQRKIVFVFPGQGAQWFGMGRQLYQTEPTFRETIQRLEDIFQRCESWSLIEQLHADEAHSRLAELNIVQPVLFAMEVALAETLRAHGISPDAVVGHSLGEPVAAYISGALSLEDASLVSCTRSRLMKRFSGIGGMAVVELNLEEAKTAIAGHTEKLSIAVSNGPRSTVISGDSAALQTVIAQLQEKGIFARAVKVDVAAHSPQMDSIRAELEEELAGLQPRQPAIPLYSTVTGALVDFPLDAAYWGRNLRQPVLFSTAVQNLIGGGYTLFVECSPHPLLLSSIEQNRGKNTAADLVTVAIMRREEDEQMHLREGLGRIFCNGGAWRWEQLYPRGRFTDLPAYPWQREHYWVDETAPAAHPRPALQSGSAAARPIPAIEPVKPAPNESFADRLKTATDSRAQRAMLESHVQQVAAGVLRLMPARVDLHRPLRAMGMDSLMSVEFTNQLQSSLELTLSATMIWNYPTLAELTAYLAEKLGILPESPAPAGAELATGAEVLPGKISDAVENLTDDELSAMLDDELKAIDDIL